MAEISGLKTLKQVVEELIFTGDKSMTDYARYLQLAIRGFKDSRLFHLKGFTKVLKCAVSDIKTITLPDDYLSFISVVVPINGQYWSLTEKESLVFSQSGVALDTDDGEGVDVSDGYSVSYGDVGGVNNMGYVKLDENNNRIIVNSLEATRTDVFLIYISTGINEAGTDTYVPDAIVPMLHFYILYKDALMHESPRAKELKAEYECELDKVRYLQMDSIQTIRDVLCSSFTSTPTR